MSFEIGIVGLPNVGKSTLFNALTNAGAAVASYPFTTIEPNVGVVPVADSRLDAIADIVRPDKVVPTTVRFVDIAGLVKGAHKGEGLGNQFLGHVRNVDAIAMVVRCFEAGDVVHVDDELDALRDIGVIDTELTLADLATVERRLEKVRSAAKARPKDAEAELEWLGAVREHLDGGQLAMRLPISPAEAAWSKELNLLTAKPRMYIVNIGEDDCPGGGQLAESVAAHARGEGSVAVPICARVEASLADWPTADAEEYLAELGMVGSGLQRVVRAGYELLDLISFFTATGGEVVRAWTVRRGATAPEAAGRVHTDMERGFIRAEVVGFDDLAASGSMAAAREAGLLQTHGREYVVQDGDVMHFRFNV
ncbi:MAG: redox-regulated ATPase YchF [Anaerolineae bacterium]